MRNSTTTIYQRPMMMDQSDGPGMVVVRWGKDAMDQWIDD
jgi:hypothetical protein